MQAAIIADDLTGAADTGVQLARAGYRTAVAFRNAPMPPKEDLDAVALDTDSRTMPAGFAAKRVLELGRAVRRILSALTPDEESWPMNAKSPILVETVRKLNDTNFRVLKVEVIRIDLDTKREAHEPALEAGARLAARYVTVKSDVPNSERTTEIFAAPTADARSYRLRPLIEPIPCAQISNLDEAIYKAERSVGGGMFRDALLFQRYGGHFKMHLAANQGLSLSSVACRLGYPERKRPEQRGPVIRRSHLHLGIRRSGFSRVPQAVV